MGNEMGKPNKLCGLSDFVNLSAISKNISYISVRQMVQKLCRLTKINHLEPPPGTIRNILPRNKYFWMTITNV